MSNCKLTVISCIYVISTVISCIYANKGTPLIQVRPLSVVDRFYRNINLRAHFGSTENNSNKPRFKSNNNCLPDKLPNKLSTMI